jgi:hypothetical protein
MAFLKASLLLNILESLLHLFLNHPAHPSVLTLEAKDASIKGT